MSKAAHAPGARRHVKLFPFKRTEQRLAIAPVGERIALPPARTGLAGHTWRLAEAFEEVGEIIIIRGVESVAIVEQRA